jgi:hypothetical protein
MQIYDVAVWLVEEEVSEELLRAERKRRQMGR